MNKKFRAFFEAYGMQTEKNRAYGIVRGYEMNALFRPLAFAAPLRIHISCHMSDEQKANALAALQRAAVPFVSAQFTPYGLLLGMNDWTSGRLLKRLPAIMDLVFGILAEQGAAGADRCPLCGGLFERDAALHTIDGCALRLDDGCLSSVNAAIDAQNRDYEAAPNNYLQGFWGAFIGGLAGIVCAIVLYFVGFISAISSVVAVSLGAFLYQKFHGKPNIGMLVIVSLTSIVMMGLSIFLIYLIAAGVAANAAGFTIGAMDALRVAMADDEFKRYFYTDLILTLLFSLLGTGLVAAELFIKFRRPKNIR